jgi:ABC-type uncharacterized transport system auxiliary subunit
MFFIALITIAAGAGLTGCGSVPETYYYMPTYQATALGNAHEPLNVVLGIEKFQADVVYSDDRIIYRESPYEVKYYNYRRWIAEPRHLVTEKAIAHLKHSGVFRDVVSFPSIVKMDYVLRGRLLAFEEWDAEKVWHGKVALAVELYNVSRDEIVWRSSFEKMTPAEKHLPVSVVEAISKSLQTCLNEMSAALREQVVAE